MNKHLVLIFITLFGIYSSQTNTSGNASVSATLTPCMATNFNKLIPDFQNMNFQDKPDCEKLMKILSHFSEDTQKSLLSNYKQTQTNLEYCFDINYSGTLSLIDNETVSQATILSTDSTKQIKESRSPVTGCCAMSQEQYGTQLEAVTPEQECSNFANVAGPPLMGMAKGLKGSCLVCRQVTFGCLFQKISDFSLNSFTGGHDTCIDFCNPTTEQITQIKEAYQKLSTSMDDYDNQVIDSTSQCINKVGLMSKCTSNSNILTTPQTPQGKLFKFKIFFRSTKPWH